MNILQLGKYHPDSTGGIEYVTAAYRDAIKILGHKPLGIYFSKNKNSFNEHEVFLKSKELFGQPLAFRYFQTVCRMSKNCSVVIAHLPNFLACFSLLILKLLKPECKLIIVWHADVVSQSLTRKVVARLMRLFEILSIVLVDEVVFTTNEYLRHSYIRRWCRKKSTIIPIPISQSSSTRAREQPLGRRLLFVGRLVEYKGIERLLQAFSKLNCEYKLIIVGDGPLNSHLSEMIRKLKNGHRVSLLGKVPNDKLWDLYSESDVFILPSIDRAEAFGVVLLEAMSHGLPLITNKLLGSGMIEVNQHNQTGLHVDVNNPTEFAAAIRKIFDKNLYATFSYNGKSRVQTHFSYDQFKTRLAKLLR